VKGTLLQRQLALAAIAALGVLGVLEHAHLRAATAPPPRRIGAYSALVGAGPTRGAGGCGAPLAPATQGIVEPVLPCGVELYLTYRHRTVLASVVAHGPVASGRAFDLTRPLAARIGLPLHGTVRLGWSYAAAS